MKASVIVPAYNAAQTIEECIEALLKQSVPQEEYEVIVVDDGSSDDTATLARSYGVRVLTQPHRGPAAARNLGASRARGGILLFTDADCAPTRTWIEEMTRPLADPEPVLSPAEAVVGVKGTYLTRQQELVARFVQIEYEDKYDRMARQERIDFVDTYSAGYRRDVFLANGGFDTTFPTASVEDQEFSFRLARKGYKMVFAPQARVYHRHDVSLEEYARRKFNIGYWKALLTQWHPERLVRDSHTPQILKLQIILLGLAALGAVLSLSKGLLATPLWPRSLWMAGGMASLFLVSAFPFVAKAATKDLAVAVVSPLLLALRATSLGLGFALGKARFAAAQKRDDRSLLSARQRAIKRAMDVMGALIGLILSAPLMPVIALAIRLDSKGPVFYEHKRVGEEGKVFQMYKFRSMVDGAEQMLDELVDVGEWPSPSPSARKRSDLRAGFKIRNDPRVTRVGRILRRTSLDEIPQFWNVLKGDMSLVGPRPEEARVVCLYTDWHRRRLAVKPGMTGPMQVNGRGDLPLDERVRLEIDYIGNYSLLTDVAMLLKTVPAILLGRGAY